MDSKKITFETTEEKRKKFKSLCAANGDDMKDVLNAAIDEYLKPKAD